MSKIVALSPAIECPPNDPRMEFMYCVLEGLPSARQKRLIVLAYMDPINFLSLQQAHELLGSLGLEEE